MFCKTAWAAICRSSLTLAWCRNNLMRLTGGREFPLQALLKELQELEPTIASAESMSEAGKRWCRVLLRIEAKARGTWFWFWFCLYAMHAACLESEDARLW